VKYSKIKKNQNEMTTQQEEEMKQAVRDIELDMTKMYLLSALRGGVEREEKMEPQDITPEKLRELSNAAHYKGIKQRLLGALPKREIFWCLEGEDAIFGKELCDKLVAERFNAHLEENFEDTKGAVHPLVLIVGSVTQPSEKTFSERMRLVDFFLHREKRRPEEITPEMLYDIALTKSYKHVKKNLVQALPQKEIRWIVRDNDAYLSHELNEILVAEKFLVNFEKNVKGGDEVYPLVMRVSWSV